MGFIDSSKLLVGGITFNEKARPMIPVSERTPDHDEAMLEHAENISNKIRVSMPAEVVSVDYTKQTIVAQPLIREKMIDKATGKVIWMQLPTLLDVPVHYPNGGGFALTFPLHPGDEVLLVFSDMCIDSWWANGTIQNWNDRRRHDLSDAIAIPGINSVPTALPEIFPTGIEMRTADGITRLRVGEGYWAFIVDDDTLAGFVGGVLTLKADTIKIIGALEVNSEAYTLHEHSGVTTGAGHTGPKT